MFFPPELFHPIITQLYDYQFEKGGGIKILDLGSGLGFWGGICRYIFDIDYGRMSKRTWLSDVTGVDVCKEYKKSYFLNSQYNQIVYTDLVSYIEGSILRKKKWDIVLCVEVLEHLGQDEFDFVIKNLCNLVNIDGLCIVTITLKELDRSAIWRKGKSPSFDFIKGLNPYQQHKHMISRIEFNQDYAQYFTETSLVGSSIIGIIRS